MRKLLGVILLLAVAATDVWAQADFTNQYLLKLKGGAFYSGDLSIGCGSRFDVNVQYEDGQSVLVYSAQHGGGGLNAFNLEIVFNSNKKVKAIITYSRAFRQGNAFQSCSRRKIKEGTVTTPINMTTPCFNRTFTNTFPGYDATRSTVSVDIQPLSKSSMKITFGSDFRNNANDEYANDPLIQPGPVGPWLVPSKLDFNYSVVASFQDGTSETIFSEARPELNARETISAQKTINYAGVKQVSSISVNARGDAYINGVNGDGYDFPVAIYPNTFAQTFPTSDLTTPGTKIISYTAFPGAAPSQLTLTAGTYSFPIKYGPDNTNILPSDPSNRITILGPVGNPASFYHWVYSLDGFTWKDFPPQYQGQHRLSISGYDLEGDAFMQNPIANRFIKIIVDCNGGESETLVLAGRISAPNITGVTPMPDRCFDREWDGAFNIGFSRPLFVDNSGNKEALTILVRDLSANANAPDQVIDVTLDEQNRFTFPRRLQSNRQYEITLLTTYRGTFGFTGNLQNHYAKVLLTRPTPVSSLITPSAVHCHNGADGQIDLSVQGGVGNYRVDYTKPVTGEFVQVQLGAGATLNLPFLSTGTYVISIYDGNSCLDKDGSKGILVDQPAAPLAIGYSAITDPLGFGYKDGYIETILIGGTPQADKSYTIEWYNPTDLLPAALQNNGPLAQGYQANLDSIGDGYYKIRAYDSQFTAAHPDHRAGCYVESELYHVIQPPPIVVALSEYHFVTCNGYNDGEVMANAQGGVPITAGPLPYQYTWLKVENGVATPVNQGDSIATQLRSGEYRVRITDKNNVQKLSSIFTLVQPDLLQTQITGTPISCTDGMNGTAAAAVQGGTTPYRYDWSEGSTTPQIGNLAAGTYFVYITDVRGCTTTASGKVDSPFPLQVDSVLLAPHCFGYTDGGIDITVSAGTAPYQYEWSNGAATQDLTNLPEGTYSVIITDANQCKNFRSYTLEDPAPVTVNLGGLRYLCNGQSYTADAALNEPGAQYVWTGPQGFTAVTSSAVLTQEGTYQVNVTDARGCKGEDRLVIKRVGVDINAEFIVSTQAFVAEEVTLLNISTTPSDSVQWWTSSPVVTNFKGKASNKAVVIFPNEGAYTLYMKAYREGCEAVFSKTITVLGTAFDGIPETGTPFIQEFTVSPNPNQGTFNVTISLEEATTIRLRLISVGDNKVVNELQVQGSSKYELPYTTNVAAGTYLLLLESPKGNDLRKVLVY